MVSFKALEEIKKLQCCISLEYKEQDGAYAVGVVSQLADINYLLAWAHGEIWIMQKTTGGDTNICLSRVVAVVLAVLFGSTFSFMHRLQTLHEVPSKKDTRTGQESSTQIWKYENGALIRNVLDTATLATCRDFPEGIIPYSALKRMLFLSAQPFSLKAVHLAASNQNGRTGNSCRACALLCPGAFYDAPQEYFPEQCLSGKRKRRPRVKKRKDGQDQSSGTPAGVLTDEAMHGPHDATEAAA